VPLNEHVPVNERHYQQPVWRTAIAFFTQHTVIVGPPGAHAEQPIQMGDILMTRITQFAQGHQMLGSQLDWPDN
jgi:hypothetical protein